MSRSGRIRRQTRVALVCSCQRPVVRGTERGVQGARDTMSTALGTDMLVQPELTPLLFPALVAVKLDPVRQKYMNKATCNGKIPVIPTGP